MKPASNDTGVPAIELRGVGKVFARNVRALDAMSLAVQTGETVALLGQSGCGKTTALRLVNRLEEPSTGEVLVRGKPVREQRPEALRRSMGYVIQEAGLFPHWSVRENVGTVPRLLDWPKSRVGARVDEMLALVGLPPEEFAARSPTELSGGQRQRVGVARALAGDPEILLMDEPFGAIDPLTRSTLHEEFSALQSRLRKTVILVTHDMLEAGHLADRIVLMDQGRVAQIGSVRELLLEPVDDFVRSFFGAHRQQLALEVLTVDDLLDGLTPLDTDGGCSLSVAGAARLGEVLGELAGASADVALSPGTGRYVGRCFAMEPLRRCLFEELIA